MVQSNGYPAESHVIETVDGYLITVHRIPYGKTPEAGPRGDKPVVFLQHGFLTSSGDWVIIGPDNALGYLLADQGYDVWMGNSRGNTYSRNHIKLNPDNSSKFWDFSFHEQAIYDLPATFDYILKKTERKKLSYFRQFDYGPAGNLKKYGSITPPNYPLERMTAPISLHYADNDWVIAVEDVEILKAKIPNFIGAFREEAL
ncbi:lipase 3-like [Lutzomyia longipalpis]|uniref:lipase 3-like n=1 Tax=Lutzomyia longipalpis TaxID=7200 RepID=UPI0024837798|nr:lipase 3-like [Lutzomyia longipalpis]